MKRSDGCKLNIFRVDNIEISEKLFIIVMGFPDIKSYFACHLKCHNSNNIHTHEKDTPSYYSLVVEPSGSALCGP